MGIIGWGEKKIRKMSIWDFALAKIILVLFGAVMGAYCAVFVRQYVIYFATGIVVLYAYLLYKILIKK